ncbi:MULTISPECIES: glycosyltransferase [Dickeya]|uniref:RhlB, TDP-rhamnosyltransferase 1 n=1 Tax=Dickeya aquatica TaxID=1401087 RepID=A0A375A8N6_9GAMM|nr:MULTISPECIES: nucleotide disphospho-sugar-binding domain-containing protein [Dickeya]SLM62400.1 RhlB, TDP-rhamnosyltransferase 1 [Dickeya aquatica]
MKIFLSTLGSAGDVYPFIAIGEVLKREGHEVSLCTNPYFEQTANARGLDFIAAGTIEDYLHAVNSPQLWQQQSAFSQMAEFMNAQQHAAYAALAPRVDSASIILTSLWSFSAKMLGETHGCCVIPVRVTPSTFVSRYDPPHHKQLHWVRFLPLPLRRACLSLIERYVLDSPLAPSFNRLRHQYGLAQVECLLTRWTHRTDAALLCLFPEWFASPQPDWPAHIRQVGFARFNLLDGAEDEDSPLDAFIERKPTIIFMPSWALHTQPTRVTALIRQVRARGYQCLIIDQTLKTPADDDGVRVFPHINLHRYLSRFRAIIHHGGIGTTAQAFAAGLPQLIIPSAFDQFDNARRVAAIGCGAWLAAHEMNRLHTTLDSLLNDPDIVKNCHRIRQQFPEATHVNAQIVAVVHDAYHRHLTQH